MIIQEIIIDKIRKRMFIHVWLTITIFHDELAQPFPRHVDDIIEWYYLSAPWGHFVGIGTYINCYDEVIIDYYDNYSQIPDYFHMQVQIDASLQGWAVW